MRVIGKIFDTMQKFHSITNYAKNKSIKENIQRGDKENMKCRNLSLLANCDTLEFQAVTRTACPNYSSRLASLIRRIKKLRRA